MGRMSAPLMRPGRSGAAYRGPELSPGAGSEELRDVLSGYIAYYGTYTVDEASHTVVHHVEAALTPNPVGADLKRKYEFSGNRLILTATMPDGRTSHIIWGHEPD